MREELLLKTLEILKNGILSQTDFLEAVLSSGYGANISKIDYKFQEIKDARIKKEFLDEDLKKRKRRFQILLSKMKKDGLIEEIGREKKLKFP